MTAAANLTLRTDELLLWETGHPVYAAAWGYSRQRGYAQPIDSKLMSEWNAAGKLEYLGMAEQFGFRTHYTCQAFRLRPNPCVSAAINCPIARSLI